MGAPPLPFAPRPIVDGPDLFHVDAAWCGPDKLLAGITSGILNAAQGLLAGGASVVIVANMEAIQYAPMARGMPPEVRAAAVARMEAINEELARGVATLAQSFPNAKVLLFDLYGTVTDAGEQGSGRGGSTQ